MKVLVLSSHTTSLFWFRMDMMKAFIRHGHKVIAVGPGSVKEWSQQFQVQGVEYREVSVDRNGINPFDDLRTYRELKQLIHEVEPDRIFTYQAKTVIYGSPSAKRLGHNEVYSLIAGLGSIFYGEGLKKKLIRSIMSIQYRLACAANKTVLFQNNDDRQKFVERELITLDKTALINGSGVNVERFQPSPLPDETAFLYIGRLIKDKGVMEYLEASKRIKEEFPHVRCLLVGPFDSNPSALKPEELQPYINEDIVEYYGEQTDVRPYIKQCTTYVLPSYHEGTPKTILEAMAMGRAIITSDAPGCRETVTEGVNGYLVEVGNVDEVVKRMRWLILDRELNAEMGKQSAEIARDRYDVNKVNVQIMDAMKLPMKEQ